MQRFKRRNWGWWLVLWRGSKFKVKLLRFKKGGSLSMQKHRFRKELWLFLGGEGKNLGKSYSKGDYLLIERLEWHKFVADKKTWVLELQYGNRCDEEDIERKDENI